MKNLNLKKLTNALFITCCILFAHKNTNAQITANNNGLYFLCIGSTYTVTVTPPGNTYAVCSVPFDWTWSGSGFTVLSYINNPNGISGYNEAVVTCDGPMDPQVSVCFRTSGCSSVCTNVVFHLANSSTTITGPDYVCGATPTPYTYSASSNISSSSYTWSSGLSCFTGSSTASNITYTVSGACNGTLTATGNGCPYGSASNVGTYSVTSNTTAPSEPGAITVTPEPTLCQGNDAGLSVSAVSGATEYVWSSTNTTFFPIENGTITSVPSNAIFIGEYSGSTTTGVIASNGCYSAKRTKLVTSLSQSSCGGRAAIKPEIEGYRIYPNPASDRLTIEYPAAAFENDMGGNFAMYDIYGNKVANWPLSSVQNQISENISSLTPGMYIYAIQSGDNILQRGKVIIQR